MRLSARVAFLWMVVTAGPVLAPASALARPGQELQIYFIDVDGGQSTLLVTPHHESLLVDSGFPGSGTFESRAGDPKQARDANRVLAATRDAGVKEINFLLATHFHGDHIGGVPELTQLLPVRTFIDHGSPSPDADLTSPGTMDLYKAYATARQGHRHIEPRPGEHLPLRDIDAVVVSAAGETLAAPLSGAGQRNTRCQTPMPPGEPYENPRSTGVLISFGRFRFLDPGDLTGKPLYRLACPDSLVGNVDVYLVAHHGGPDAADPAVLAAFHPRVAIMNNGEKKGGARATYETLHHLDGLLDTWQLHRSAAAAEENFPEKFIANLDESSAHWIKLTARKDGSFTVFNARTGESSAYGPDR